MVHYLNVLYKINSKVFHAKGLNSKEMTYLNRSGNVNRRTWIIRGKILNIK